MLQSKTSWVNYFGEIGYGCAKQQLLSRAINYCYKMPIKTPTPTQDQIDTLRKLFIEKLEKEPPKAPFHAVDLDRVKNADLWCARFLEMYDLDMNVCIEKLWDVCIWRQKYGANDLNENNLRKEYLLDGVVFTRNKDLDGKPLLIFRTKLHNKGTKDMDEVMRVVVYWIERIHRQTNMDKITVFFDMSGTGLTNMDMDFVKRIIETFKLYYPNALNYILIFELAWVLNAAFKIIKGILPAKALEILKMITKKDVNTYVDKDNCLTSWGGNDDYEFTFVPEVQLPSPKLAQGNGSVPAATDEQLNNADKKVHFANSSPTRVPQMKDLEDHYTPNEHDMLRISPTDFITFAKGEYTEGIVDITSISKIPVTYKIQTTAPEKFRVRPRCGILNAGESVSVSIVLKSEHQLTDGSKDKFLVMGMPVPLGVDTAQIADVWKQKVSPNCPEVEQHRLCCIYKTANAIVKNGHGGELASDGGTYDLSVHAKKLEKQLRTTQTLQWITIFFLMILGGAVVYLLQLQMNDDGHKAQKIQEKPLPSCKHK